MKEKKTKRKQRKVFCGEPYAPGVSIAGLFNIKDAAGASGPDSPV